MQPLAVPEATGDARSLRAELERLVRCHFQYIWRLLRRLGLPPSDADDAAQQVFMVASGKLEKIQPGSERSFLYGCALNRAAKWQRARARERRTVSLDAPLVDELVDGACAEDSLDRDRARGTLDALLASLPAPLRTVLVLYELEQLSTIEIAALLEVPRGTVASRLRRAREEFEKRIKRLEAQNRSGAEER